ncbi:chemotaxis protein CheA [Virgibacillus indicus]|uniref:Chemotaxis protein CheA n=1 Tax=Virgibacillus indicus TaxID=2024554 RepID=A0A265NEQ3_9BACI|nr:chemotaxis protein CheA [Virgibacillus indicus]OZU90301.1 chemotaxis protein CheA [Virgibacillus indicus]
METAEYLDVFIDESKEHLEVLYKQLLALEKEPAEKSIIDEIFRAAHTLKGMSATMGYNDLASLTHQLENVFDAIKYEKITVTADMMDIMFEAVDHLTEMVDDIASGGNGVRDVEQIVFLLDRLETGVTVEQTKNESGSRLEETTTVLQVIDSLDEFELSILNEASERGFSNYEITITLNEDCLLKGARVFMVFEVLEKLGEVIKTNPSVNDLEEENFDFSFSVILVSNYSKTEIEEKINKVSEINKIETNLFSAEQYKTMHEEETKELSETKTKQSQNSVQQKEKTTRKSPSGKTIRVNIERLDVLMNLFEEFVIDKGRLEQISTDLNNNDLQDTVEHISRVSADLQNIILTMRMVPVDQVFSRFPRMIRQLAKDLHKNVEIEIIGADTELDRTVIDEIGDPLVHLIRNAIDHGIETSEERKKKGKAEKGTIQLKAFHSGNHVFIEISDDGAGIDKEKVVNKALANGIINESQIDSLTDQQIYELIMASGFSTADAVSDISGRGVGLDVVRNTIESLGGTISIDAELNKGSTFSIQLPLTLTIISVLLVELQNEKYAIPLSSILETAIVRKDQILSAHNKKVIDFRDKIVPLVFLNDIFSVPEQGKNKNDYVSIVIVKKGEKMAGLVVDSFIGQQEVVLKSLGNYLSNTFAISGATILGDGEVALIIDSNALL